MKVDESSYQAYVRKKIEQGIGDLEAGRTLSEKEFDLRMARWLVHASGSASR